MAGREPQRGGNEEELLEIIAGKLAEGDVNLTNDLTNFAHNDEIKTMSASYIRGPNGEAGKEAAACSEGEAPPVVNSASPRTPSVPPIQQRNVQKPEKSLAEENSSPVKDEISMRNNSRPLRIPSVPPIQQRKVRKPK
mmetsp:Transcript_6693/g.16180  ORF Transcript_6693/g.16180 Transcript_6693/m.16180 type:complete len:138 (-) Transcript_6693:340-753(-)|eukprot:CAMPEP_0198347386 /NCGR_PEP_ID=MMETSP1450-20131203/84638_1 /TAXON_ID=753684 ORGANISM="Madagascaria erythrocladiodes, Strain CCMP3234" /NCGR_SAMPLE_ID=MMETSP1450 /ASSEMBLY_ACC=CAM_ASM_001115 /LENGTH=137 /DNA_ID=CAMNT_0044052903 /DNA_START=84 /DNA_END=497 /DNA_ORIENTATION=-